MTIIQDKNSLGRRQIGRFGKDRIEIRKFVDNEARARKSWRGGAMTGLWNLRA
jgi:hypothetical protein